MGLGLYTWKICIKHEKSDVKVIFWYLQQMGKVIRPFCWHQNIVPKGLSAPVLGLYTCIKSLKTCIKSDFKEILFKTCNKWSWPMWQYYVSVDIIILSPGGCLPLPRGYIHLLNHEKMYIKSEVELMGPFCWHQNSSPNGLSVPAEAICSLKSRKRNVHKIIGLRYFWNMQPAIKVIRLSATIKIAPPPPRVVSPCSGAIYIHIWTKTKYHMK